MATVTWLQWILSFLPRLPRRKRPRGGNRPPISPAVKTGPSNGGRKVQGSRITKSPPRSPKNAGTSRKSSPRSSPIRTSQGQPSLSPKRDPPGSSPKQSPVKSKTGQASTPLEQDPVIGSSGGQSKHGSAHDESSRHDPSTNEVQEPTSGSQGKGAPKSFKETPPPPPPPPAIEWNRFPDNITSRRTKGLANRGNFCYRNATLQALLHLPAFYRYMRGMQHQCGSRMKGADCVVCGLKSLTTLYWHGEDGKDLVRNIGPFGERAPLDGPVAALRAFNLACRCNPPEAKEVQREFILEHQCDPYDFLQYLLEHIGRRESSRDISTFANMFAMSLETGWTCEDCDEVTTTTTGGAEALSVGIEDPKKGLALTEYIAHELQDQRRIRCGNQDCPQTSVRSKMDKEEGPVREWHKNITNAPQILVVRMKRYGTYKDEKNVLRHRKIFDDVEFDEYLDLSEFANEDCTYRLDAVVAHSGANIHLGHIIAAVRDCNEEQFHIINDDVILGTSRKGRGTFAELQHPTCLGDEKQPYMLFYSRCS